MATESDLFSLPKEAFLFSTRPKSASVVAAKVEAVARVPQISSKGPKRVSWDAAYIAVSPTRVCGLRVFVFWETGCRQPVDRLFRLSIDILKGFRKSVLERCLHRR